MEISEIDKKIKSMSSRLKLTYIRDNFSDMLESANETKMTPRETLEFFFSKEIERREFNRIKLSTMAAHFPYECSLETFDMSAQQALDPGIIRELAQLEWIKTGKNVLFLGPPGVGKTHLAIGLGRRAIQQGFSVRFISAANLLTILEKANKEGSLTTKLNDFFKYKLLIIDELGYLPFSPECAHLLFQLISRRYECKSTVITSNRPPSEWGVIFGDSMAATAILDRLLHHCTPVSIMGDSFRMKASKKEHMINE